MKLITPRWAAPARVSACSTTREGGVSQTPYASLNLGLHVGDVPEQVEANRQRLCQALQLPTPPIWLEQVHGTRVLTLTDSAEERDVRADAAYTRTPGQVCAVMTADCLPVLFTSLRGDEVAAAHAGWRGLCHGVLEQTLACFAAEPSHILAWLGPAIGPTAFEVGPEVREQFIEQDAASVTAFQPVAGGKYLADIYALARLRLQAVGVRDISGGDCCTLSDPQRFFSYRRAAQTGRMASLIWFS
ncbi:purine nucleoside phosphorylase YfiH [Edwardsiella tarda]|uniref:purine nucleoside phosphorylase YfiH n=1 Tax=Edwardsiella tarda TaxID=636 RepID=UPI00351C749C